MTFLGLASSFSIRSHLSVAIVSMTDKSIFNDAPVLTWDSRMKGTVMSSFYWGYVFTLILAGRVSEKFGHKFPIVMSMLVSGIIMVLTPFAAIYGGFYWMIVTRILLGIAQAKFIAFVYFILSLPTNVSLKKYSAHKKQLHWEIAIGDFKAVTLPAANVFFSKWVPIEEKATLFYFVFSGLDFGILVTMVVSGVLSDSCWGWPSIFYVCGGVTILWTLVYAYVGVNSPQNHSTISEHEKLYILSSLQNNVQEQDNLQTVPWKAIASSVPLYAIIIAHSVTVWAYYTIVFQAPSYLNAVLGFSIKQSGLFAALPYVSSILTAFVYAMINHWLTKKKILSRNAQLKAWNTYSLWGTALMLFLLAFAGENKIAFIALLTAALTTTIGYHGGYHSNHIDLSPNFAGTLMGITTAISTLSTLSTPLYVGFIVTDPKSVFSWRIVFLTAAGLLFVGNLFFIIFATTEVQPWNFPPSIIKPDPEGAIPKDKNVEDECHQLE